MFAVKELRDLIDGKLLIGREGGVKVMDWCRLASKKVNVFWWKLCMRRIPVNWKLDQLGIDMNSILCPRCETCIETMDHAIFECPQVKEIWTQTLNWWGIQSDIRWDLNLVKDKDSSCWKIRGREDIWKATVWCLANLIWRNRNEVVF